MTRPPGLLSMKRISTRCQINSSLYINSDCSRHWLEQEIKNCQIKMVPSLKFILTNLSKVM